MRCLAHDGRPDGERAVGGRRVRNGERYGLVIRGEAIETMVGQRVNCRGLTGRYCVLEVEVASAGRARYTPLATGRHRRIVDEIAPSEHGRLPTLERGHGGGLRYGREVVVVVYKSDAVGRRREVSRRAKIACDVTAHMTAQRRAVAGRGRAV